MPPKRAATDNDTVTGTDTGDTLMPPPPPPPPPTTPSSKRRRTSRTHSTGTPSTTAPPSLFFEVPLPPPYDPDASNEPPSDSQFAAFLQSAISTLPAPTQALYASAMRNLAPENTPELTGEMRASLTSAVTGFVVHFSAAEWERDGGGGPLLTKLARGEVSGRELVLWADTITAALRAFSGIGGPPAPSWPSSPVSAGSPIPAQSLDPATPTPRTPAATAPARYSSHSGRSTTIRTSALTRDDNACVLTSLAGPTALEVAHIVPFSVRGAKADAFWGFLGLFLGVQGAERVRWATLRLANGDEQRQPGALVDPVNELANCITLAAHAHKYFDAGMIELLPVPGSGAWSGDYDPSVVSSYDVRISFPGQALLPLISRCIYSDGTRPQLLSSTQITPGDIVTLTTTDPTQWPLPHPLLLQLHALCGRVKRLRAAAGWPVLPYGDGSENEVGWGEEVEVWDEDEEEGTKARWEGQFEGSAAVLGCGAARAVPEPGPESSMARGSGRKREFGAAVGEEQEEMLEWPRKVAVVMGEMGMREEERWRLMKGSSARGGNGFV